MLAALHVAPDFEGAGLDYVLPEASDSSERLYLDLGEVREIAQVRLGGRDLGVLWQKPFRVALGGVARPGWNDLEIAVTNL